MRWNKRYLNLAKEVSAWSKDPSRKIGAVAVGSKGQILSQGYNGFPRGIDDSIERLDDRPTKYKYVVHAEMNVIYNATFSGVSLDGAALYVYGLPICSECAKGIIQVGIKEVHIFTDQYVDLRWLKSWEDTRDMFDEAGVKYSEYCADYNSGFEPIPISKQST
jgi:dCMP deaminase